MLRLSPTAALTALLLLTGCVSPSLEHDIANTNQVAFDFTYGQLRIAQSASQRAALAQTTQALLQQALGQREAVLLMLANSAELQVLLLEHSATSAQAAQSGRIANPVFQFERMRTSDGIEINRLLSLGLLDLLLLPQRQQNAQQQLTLARLRLSSQVVAQVTTVRLAWVRAVAAQQNLLYARQVLEAANASAELAQRLQAAGNFSALQAARQQVFSNEAQAQVTSSEHEALAAREALIRVLGLDEMQAKQLTLPERLPELPASPQSEEEMKQVASKTRLDMQIAQAQFNQAASAQGLPMLATLTDVELGLRRNSKQEAERGAELSIRLPLWDFGEQQRAQMNAQTLAAAQRLQAARNQASSQLRESYSAYRSAWQIAKQYRDEVVPLRKKITAENLLRYNGMLASVFDVLQNANTQIASVQAALNAQRQFWLSDASLQANLLGAPSAMMGEATLPANNTANTSAH